MKRTALLGCTVLTIALALPIYGQAAQATLPSIDDAYTTYYIAPPGPQQTALAEKLLTDYKGSKDPSAEQYFETAFATILSNYSKANDFAKVIDYADKTEQLIPGATPAKKAYAYSQGMTAAQQSNNIPKIVSFGEKALALVPDGPEGLNTLLILSSVLSAPGADAAALAKSDEFATKALAIAAKIDPKTVGLSDAAWASQRMSIESTLHATLGGNAYTRKDYEKAVEELTIATKDDPKNELAWYQLGLTFSAQASELSVKYGAAVTQHNKLAADRHADRGEIDELAATSDALAEALRPKRDAAIDALGTAVALGGPAAEPARAQLQRLWSQKNNGSTDGMEAFIASKKG